MRNITASELQARLAAEGEAAPRLIDVREPWEYDICRIQGSELIPMREIVERAGELDPGRETVVICHHGIRSRQIALFLEHQAGFTDVINLVGGVAAWAREVDPQMPTY